MFIEREQMNKINKYRWLREEALRSKRKLHWFESSTVLQLKQLVVEQLVARQLWELEWNFPNAGSNPVYETQV